MKTYLVGGAVRDTQLGLAISEKDWVVLGETEASMLAAGFQKAGRDFPVFLHPETGEEYALARKERKTAPGYQGFSCDVAPSVTLEEDLMRRDLTINAMAMDSAGNIIDPFGGRRDLKARVLRHVSEAFVEDPVRVLRIARFLARFHHLGFTIAKETRCLMYDMVCQGELASLVPERVWQECLRALSYQHPDYFIYALRASGALAVIFPEIDALFGVPNAPQHHPEIDSGIHTLQVLMKVTKMSQSPVVRFGALLHDLGKIKTSYAVWPKHPHHDEMGSEVISQFCRRLKVPLVFLEFSVLVSRFHLMLHRVETLTPDGIVRVFEKMDAFRRTARFYDALKVAAADVIGEYHQYKLWEALFSLCVEVTATPYIQSGFSGQKISRAMHEERVNRVSNFMKAKNHEK